MRSFIYILFIALLAASCSPAKQIARLQGKGYLLPSIDTIYSPGEVRDTTITIYVEGDTVVKEVLLFVEVESVEMEPVEVDTEFAHAKAHIENNKIILTLIQKEAFFEHNLEDVIRRDTIYIKNIVEVIKEVQPKSHTFYKSGFFILLGLIIIIIILLLIFIKRK